MNKKRWIGMLTVGMLAIFLWGQSRLFSRAEESVCWLDGIWLNGEPVEETEGVFPTGQISLTVHMQEEQAVRVMVISRETSFSVPLQVETQEDGWLAEAVIVPQEGIWRFCLLWEQDTQREVTIYESADFVTDGTAPEAEICLEPQAAENGEEVFLLAGVRVRELHWDPQLAELHLYRRTCGQKEEEEFTTFGESGRWQETEDGIWEWRWEVKEEGIWRLEFCTADLAGNLAEREEKEQTLDLTAPQLAEISFTEDGKPVTEERQASMVCREKLEGRIWLEDRWSGVAGCSIWAQKEGEEKQLLETWQADTPAARSAVTFCLTEEGRWKLWVEVWDAAGNTWQEERLLGEVCVDTLNPDVSFFADGTEGAHGFYTGDVRFRVEAEDAQSGLEKMVLFADGEPYMTVTCGGKSRQEEKAEVPDTYEGIHRWTLQVWDMAGNRTEVEKEIRLDLTAPAVELKMEEMPVRTRGYYARPGKIRVCVREAFPETPCVVDIYRQGSYWQSVSCTSAGEGQYEASLLAEEEGQYVLQAVCRDLAGNVGETGMEEPFVVDRTAPVIRMSWETSSAQGEKVGDVLYTSGMQTALLAITDDFLDEKDIACVLEKDGVSQIQSLPFVKNGTEWTARLHLEEEGTYRLLLSAQDLAGNRAESYESQRLVLDNTPPELSFGKGSGEKLVGQQETAPWVKASDLHLKEQGLTVQLYCTGTAPGQTVQPEMPLHLPGELIREGQEDCFSYAPWPLQQRLDGCYRLEARAEDLAGNVRQEVWNFTVNRFGSVFQFGQELLAAGQKYYVNQKPEILIREYNPDHLISRKILVESEAGVRALQEGRDYTASQMYGNGQWNCYIYRFHPEVLKTDGSYRLSVHTADQAGNTMDTRKQQELSFFLDREAPVIRVEQGKGKGMRKVQVSMEDLSGIETAVFDIDEKEVAVYGQEQIRKAGGQFTLTVPPAGEKHTVTVKARDLAGNQAGTEPLLLPGVSRRTEKKNEPERRTEKMKNRSEDEERKLTAGFLFFLCMGLLAVVQICVKKRKKKQRNC